MKLTTIICIVIIQSILNLSGIKGQVILPDPITKSTSNFSSINSDFGPRNAINSSGKQISIFHYGIDYPRKNDKKAYAVENGEILDFNKWNKNYAYIRIRGNHTWRYMHVETSQYTLPNQTTPIWEYAPDFFGPEVIGDDFIFLREYDDENDIFTVDNVFGTTHYEGEGYIIIDPKTEDIALLKTSVNQKQWMFIARDYGTSGNDDDHLHLGDNWRVNRNAFKIVAYKDEHKPHIDYAKPKYVKNDEATEFEGTNIFGNPIILESKIDTRRTSGNDQDMDYYRVTASSTDYNNVSFTDYLKYTEGEGSLKHNVDIDHNITILNTSNHSIYEKAIDKGVFPFKNLVSLDYFKLHWPSTESKVEEQADAYVNEKAVYPDGQYNVVFRATDIRGNESTKQMDVVLDNHIPYVKGVQIENGTAIYSSQVNYVNPENPTISERGKFVRKDSDYYPDCADFQNDLDFFVELSEPMQNVSIQIHEGSIFGVLVYENNMQKLFNSNINWRLNIPKAELEGGNFDYGNNYFLRISGNDMAGNEIMYLGLAADGDEANVNIYPYRNPDNNYEWWTGYAKDERDHWFSFCELDMLRAIFTLENPGGKFKTTTGDPVYGNSPLTINFSDASTGNPENWTWDFGDMSLPVDEQNTTHTFVNETEEPIQYNVSLKVCNGEGCDIAFKSKLITVYPEGYSNIPIADFAFTQETYAQPFYVEFNNYSVGNINTTKWDFGDNTFSSDENPEPHQYSTPGTYLVKLTINEDAAEESVYEQQIEVLEGSSNFGPIDFEWACIANINNMQNGEGLNGELIDFKTTDYFYSANYEWDMGDGTNYYTSSPSYAYLNTGIYPVTLTITDFDGELIGKKTKMVTVIQQHEKIPAAENEIVFENEILIEDVEITDDGDYLFVVPWGNTVYLYNYSYSNETWEENNSQPTISFEYDIGNITVSGDLLLVSCPLQDDFRGKVYFYKRINGIWVKQVQELVPDDYWLRFGHFMDMEDGIVLVSAFDEQGKLYQVSIMEYNLNTNQWQVLDKKYTNPHPGSPKISYSNGFAAINSDVYKKPSNGTWWPKVEDAVIYNADYILNGQETVTVGSKYLASSVQDMENPYINVFVHNGSSFTALPSIKITNDNMAFANSLSSFENYLLSGNNDRYILNCNNSVTFSESSTALFRANSNDFFYLYSTTVPSNGTVGDHFGEITRITRDNIIVCSQRLQDIYGNTIKDPGVYFYRDYAYFGDRELDIPSMEKYRRKDNDPLRFEARTIEIGGSAKSSVISGDNLDLIGQRVVLNPGFSATGGAIFKATGTICTDFYEPGTSKGSVNEDLNGTVFLPEIEDSNQHYKNGFIIIPNPGTNYINIKATDNTASIKKVKIYTLSGKTVIVKNADGAASVPMDVSSISRGIYIAAVYSEGLCTKLKFVKL